MSAQPEPVPSVEEVKGEIVLSTGAFATMLKPKAVHTINAYKDNISTVEYTIRILQQVLLVEGRLITRDELFNLDAADFGLILELYNR
jgi:hypothetical protein